MEKKEETTEEYVHRIVTPIFDRILNKDSPQEISNNTMSVSVDTTKHPITFFWRPNNYRLQIPFNKEKINLGIDTTLLKEKRQGSVINTTHGKLKISNFGSKISGKINGLPIMIDKNSITITYSLRTSISPKEIKKAVYKIEADNIEDIHKRIDERVNQIKDECLNAVKEFVKLYGGWGDFDKAKWIRHEDAIHKEDWIPDEVIIHDTQFKKVYPTQVEMKSPAFIKNFYSNRVIEEIAPQIAKEIKDSHNSIETLKNTIVNDLNPILKDFTAQMRLHLEVQTETKETLKELRKPFFIRWYNHFKQWKK